jgi:hypothetical protein
MRLVRRFILFALLGPFLAAAAHAVTLDWDGVTWTPGSLSNSYDVDPANAGNDVTVTVSGSTAQLQPGLASPNPQTPAITTALEGGLSPVQKSLEIAVDLANQAQAIVVTVNFSAGYTQGVQNVSFTIFDVDFANGGGSTFQDELRSIQAVGADGVTLIAPTITVGSDVSLTGTALSQVATGIATNTDTGPTSGNGNVTISFGATAIKSFTFTYGSGSGTVADPTYQHIALHDITYSPVPETNPAWSAIASCLVAAGLILRHSAKFRK